MPISLVRLYAVVDTLGLKQVGLKVLARGEHQKRLVILALASAAFLAAPIPSFAGSFKTTSSYKASAASSCAVAKGHSQPCDQQGQGAELEMINLQSLVSQRQQAVQLTTDILHHMQCDKCIANIGK